jgi:predicted phage terminase large subunit-like protein
LSVTQKTVRAIGPQPGKQTDFLSSSADLVIYGGAAGGGKTAGLLLEPLRHISNPQFAAVFFRRTFPQITNPGAMWDESMKFYPYVGGVGRKSSLTWTFPSGARIEFAHLQYEETKLNWQGSQIALLCWDELTHYTESQFFYLLSRNRSTSGVRPYVRATCNPDADSWVAKFIAWWIDPETGYAIPERSGVVRWFARLKGEIIWGDTPGEVETQAGEGAIAKSCTFISAHVQDNQILMKLDPGYLANLMALPLVERERLLGGNWKIRAAAGLVFNRAWFGEMLPAAPVCEKYVRYWDKASAVDGDFTAGVLMGVRAGTYYVIDVRRDRLSTYAREDLIKQTAQLDKQAYGPKVVTWIEQEGGSGGKDSAVSTVRNLAGLVVRVERPSADKVTRAEPMSAQAEVGNVRLVLADWNEAFLSELHGFPMGAHDDQVDASSGAFNRLALGRTAQVSGPLEEEEGTPDVDPNW